jgi:hypothetical protein
MFGSELGVAGVVTLVVGALFSYFIPAVIAEQRHHPNTKGVVLLNLLLGWTVLCWIAALAWACSSFEPQPKNEVPPRSPD